MKVIYSFLIVTTLLFFGNFSLQAQSSEGTDFWFTFGAIGEYIMNPENIDYFDFRIRIVNGNAFTSGTIYFTSLGTAKTFTIEPYETYIYILTNDEKYAIYPTTTGITDFSIHITTSHPVAVYAFKMCLNMSDASNILPVTALGTEYYTISWKGVTPNDAYAVIATQNNTLLYHNETLVGTLNAGQVYYRYSYSLETGDHLTSNYPVAFFALNPWVTIPQGGSVSCIFQQLAPVHTWGKTFLVPVTVVDPNYVRIVVSQNNTNIQQTGGIIRTSNGGQSDLSQLQAGQFVELEISLDNNGCYISADKPVGVCSFMKSAIFPSDDGTSSQVWIPAIEQSLANVLMAPFESFFMDIPLFHSHYAIISTATATKDNTTVSIGGSSPISLNDGTWYDADAGMSFCNFPLTNLSASHNFSNPERIIVFGYGIGNQLSNPWVTSYYYLAGSGMRNLSAAFTANGIPSTELAGHSFQECDITFVANIEGIHSNPGSLKWYINDPGKLNPLYIDQENWTQTFTKGTHTIIMSVLFEDESTEDYEGILNVVGRFIKIRNVRY